MRLFVNLLLSALFAAGLAIPALPHGEATGAPEGGWVGFDRVTDRDHLDPADGHEAEVRALGCRVTSTDDSLGDRAVILEDGTVTRWTFDEVASSDRRFWVIGACS
jgi:hypothetical protein